MKRWLLPLLCLPMVAVAGKYTATANIVSVQPVYTTKLIKEPYQECYTREYRVPAQSGDGSATNELIGGVIGGAIGNQFGAGSGKDAMTIMGALIGGSVANDMEKQEQPGRIERKEVCETFYRTREEEVLDYYRVRFSYDGNEFTYRTQTRPQGDTVQVEVDVRLR